MRRVTKMALGIGIPVAVVLITAVILISVSIKTVGRGEICVLLNKNNEPVNQKTYRKGVYFIGLVNHLSPALPDKGKSILGAIQSQGETKPEHEYESEGDYVNAYVFFKYYIGENFTHRFFSENGYNMTAMDIPNVFTKAMMPVVRDLVSQYKCSQISNEDISQDTWCKWFAGNASVMIRQQNLPFVLDEDDPVRAVFFTGDC